MKIEIVKFMMKNTNPREYLYGVLGPSYIFVGGWLVVERKKIFTQQYLAPDYD